MVDIRILDMGIAKTRILIRYDIIGMGCLKVNWMLDRHEKGKYFDVKETICLELFSKFWIHAHLFNDLFSLLLKFVALNVRNSILRFSIIYHGVLFGDHFRFCFYYNGPLDSSSHLWWFVSFIRQSD